MPLSTDLSLAALLVVSLSFATLGAASAASAATTTTAQPPAQSNGHVSAEAKVGFNPQPDPPGIQRAGDGSVKPAAQR